MFYGFFFTPVHFEDGQMGNECFWPQQHSLQMRESQLRNYQSCKVARTSEGDLCLFLCVREHPIEGNDEYTDGRHDIGELDSGMIGNDTLQRRKHCSSHNGEVQERRSVFCKVP